MGDAYRISKIKGLTKDLPCPRLLARRSGSLKSPLQDVVQVILWPTWIQKLFQPADSSSLCDARAAPEIVTLYAANFPATAIRAKIRQEFEKNKYVDDLEAVDILLLKGYQEFQETINAWKMDSHLYRMFAKEEVGAITQTQYSMKRIAC